MTTRFLTLLFIILLMGCTPLGYIQSPRVRSGVVIGPHGAYKTVHDSNNISVTSLEKFRIVKRFDGEIDTLNINDYYSSFNTTLLSTYTEPQTYSYISEFFSSRDLYFWLLNPRFGIGERVRFSGSFFLLPMNGFPWVTTSEFMINIIDIGEPSFFNNIALGALINIYVSSGGDEHAPANIKKSVTGGLIAGTHQQLSHGEIEFCFGAGASRYLSESVVGRFEGSEPLVYFSKLLYTADVSSSMHISFARDNKAQFTLGATAFFPVYQDFWISRQDSNVINVEIGSTDVCTQFKVQTALSWRFGRTKSQ